MVGCDFIVGVQGFSLVLKGTTKVVNSNRIGIPEVVNSNKSYGNRFEIP